LTFWNAILAQCADFRVVMRLPQTPFACCSRVVDSGLRPRVRACEELPEVLFVFSGTVGRSTGFTPFSRGGHCDRC
jgi:hypothetical protein